MPPNVSDSLMVVRADQVRAQADFVNQFGGRGLGRQKAIRPAFHHAAFNYSCLQQAAQHRFALNQRHRTAGFGQRIGRRQPADAAADDDRLAHGAFARSRA